ncbi:carotenoid ester lipase [Coprinopsis sp. MPI-PUGE-AT-0042]|nr:carotenoid ester lipase [Coprinopsis sp. MPI-PUGE-AT-0042]
MLSFLLLSLALGALAQSPTVSLDQANVTGTQVNGTIDKFLGIPFAQPPVGDLRFRLPVNITSYNQSFDATQYGYTCINQNSSSSTNPFGAAASLFSDLQEIFDQNSTSVDIPEDEDCLTLNVLRPSGIDANASLPVLVWIYGGGFEGGSTIGYDELTTSIVNRSIEMEKPMVVVSMNYRLNAFGFLASQEVADEGVGNIGLHDQREALRWIQRYIGAFGGNSSHVTIWGQSAGAISASLQMVAYNGTDEGLFHAAFMQSGAPIPIGNLTGGQPYYNDLVNATGCGGQNDTLSCLRSVPVANLTAGINQSPGIYAYQSLALAWTPRADGIFLTEHPQRLVEADKVVHVPMVCGNVDDEGTVFAGSTLNITTDAEFETYVKTIFIPGASEEDLESLWEAYPSDPSKGSPFDTSALNAITPQFKRMAAFQGDVVFQAPRRFFLQHQSGKQPIWSYLSRRSKELPILGSFHSSEIVANLLNDYVIQFTNDHDPSLGGTDDLPDWPQYTNESPNMYNFGPALLGSKIEITQDTYREEGMGLLSNLSLRFPL